MIYPGGMKDASPEEKSVREGEHMETYAFYPPQLRPTRLSYQVIAAGVAGCRHELLDDNWQDRISVQDGIIFVTFSCKLCGRQICQSLEEVLPPASWKGGSRRRRMQETYQPPVQIVAQP